MRFERGAVVRISLGPTVGHGQRGARPCIVVSDPQVTEDRRYPMLCVAPLTGTPGVGATYPALRPGASGLRRPSWALVDQLRAIDKRRVVVVFGVIPPDEMAAVDEGIQLFLGLAETTPAGE